MSKALEKIVSVAAALPIANVDTDQLLPKQFLTTLERTGLGRGLLHDMRFDESGAPRPEFVLNRPPFDRAAILIAGPNLGCGSSREHAPWALRDFGVRCVIAPSFGEIFRTNCVKNGILPAQVSQADADSLADEAPGGEAFIVDLATQVVTAPSGRQIGFFIEPGARLRLLSGYDEIGLTLQRIAEIEAYEEERGLA